MGRLDEGGKEFVRGRRRWQVMSMLWGYFVFATAPHPGPPVPGAREGSFGRRKFVGAEERDAEGRKVRSKGNECAKVGHVFHSAAAELEGPAGSAACFTPLPWCDLLGL